MCEICHQTPCTSRCPNAEEPKAVLHCVNCGDPIYEGDNYYNIGDGYCEYCVINSLTTADKEE